MTVFFSTTVYCFVFCVHRATAFDGLLAATVLGKDFYDEEFMADVRHDFSQCVPDPRNMLQYASFLNAMGTGTEDLDSRAREAISNASRNTLDYDAKKEAVLLWYIEANRKHEHLRVLFDTFVCQKSGKVLFNITECCGGIPDSDKKNVINHTLYQFAKYCVKKEHRGANIFMMEPEDLAEIVIQPNTNQTRHKMLFSVLREGLKLNFFLKDFQNGGGFMNWWTETYRKCEVFNSQLGGRPRQVGIEPNYYEKIMTCEEPFLPFQSYEDCRDLLMLRLAIDLARRSGKEVSHQSIETVLFTTYY
jgi:hypothetical protein